jgi:hypothetical protein
MMMLVIDNNMICVVVVSLGCVAVDC